MEANELETSLSVDWEVHVYGNNHEGTLLSFGYESELYVQRKPSETILSSIWPGGSVPIVSVSMHSFINRISLHEAWPGEKSHHRYKMNQ